MLRQEILGERYRSVVTADKPVDLTSRPSRAAANRLYRKLGFEIRDSKVFRLATVD